MARYIAEGAQVTLVTCTRGEHGEILVPELADITPDQLGEHRLVELAEAMRVLGVTDYLRLGGDGRYRDTGMMSAPDGTALPPEEIDPASFWRADLLEAANHLVEVIRDRRPQVVVTYNPMGGYGHPDHIQAHRVTTYAISLAAMPSHRPDLGEAWQVDRLLWNTWRAESFRAALAAATESGLELGFSQTADSPPPFGAEDADLAAVIESAPWRHTAWQALACHKTQVRTDDDFWRFFKLLGETPGAGEAYQLAMGVPFPDQDGLADDLFLGLA